MIKLSSFFLLIQQRAEIHSLKQNRLGSEEIKVLQPMVSVDS